MDRNVFGYSPLSDPLIHRQNTTVTIVASKQSNISIVNYVSLHQRNFFNCRQVDSCKTHTKLEAHFHNKTAEKFHLIRHSHGGWKRTQNRKDKNQIWKTGASFWSCDHRYCKGANNLHLIKRLFSVQQTTPVPSDQQFEILGVNNRIQ